MTGFVPARLSIFKLAFSHKSNHSSRDYAHNNNERLEYLGDAVLGTVVAEYLFKKYPNADEGFLTKMRSKIVKRKSLNHIGKEMELDVLLSEYNRTRLSPSMLGNAVEALVGAVYLEKGYRPTKRFVIQRMLKLYVDVHELETVDDNYKSQLLEHCQKNGKTIAYKLVKKFKQDRRDRFKVAVVVGGKDLATADDFNKKSAEQLASKRALVALGVLEKSSEKKGGKSKPARAKPKAEKVDHSLSATSNQKTTKEINLNRPEKVLPKSTTKAVHGDASPASADAKTQRQENAPKHTGSAPPPKKRRNHTNLGRAIWHGTSTAAAALSMIDLGQKVAASRPATAKKTGAEVPTSTAVRQSVKDRSNKPTKKSAYQDAIDHVSAVVSIRLYPADNSYRKLAPPKVKTKVVSKKSSQLKAKPPQHEVSVKTVRRRRPVPLRILTPALADIAAALTIEVASDIDEDSTPKAATELAPLENGHLMADDRTPEVIADWEDSLLDT